MTKTISILILASAAIHAAVLGLINFDSTESISIGTRMRISIQAPSTPQTNNDTEPTENNDIIKSAKLDTIKHSPTEVAIPTKTIKQAIRVTEIHEQPDKQQQEITKSINEPAPDQKTTVIASLESVREENSTPSESSLSAHTSSLLYSDLEQAFALHFYYPRLAIRRGWSGEVQLSLRIEADGKLSQIRLLNSSGFGLLDKAAINSLDKVEILQSAIALLNGNSLDLILPVEYRLL